jgi:N-acetylglutamate synthase-like GNAT family acetyltransferase
MSLPVYRARRAHLDDLPALKALWETMRLPAADLEKHLTDFQVVHDSHQQIVGAVGFQMAQRHGRIHSEAFSDFGITDQVRPLLWTRIQTLSTNHGIYRVWTQERVPFWIQNGFQLAAPSILETLPETWDRTQPGWLTLQLKDEQALASLDKEFAMFVESEKGRSAEALSQARTLKTVLLTIAGLIILALAVGAIYVFVTRVAPGSPPH